MRGALFGSMRFVRGADSRAPRRDISRESVAKRIRRLFVRSHAETRRNVIPNPVAVRVAKGEEKSKRICDFPEACEIFF